MWLLGGLLLVAGCGGCRESSEPQPDTAPRLEVRRPPARTLAAGGARAPTPAGRIVPPTLALRPTKALAPEAAPTFPPAPEPPPEEDAAAGTEAELADEGDCVVIIDADPDFGEPPLTVNFSVESQCPSGIPTYAWDFGDQSPPSSEPAPVHVFEKAGEYLVRLRAAAPDGSRASDELDITVEAGFEQ
ncbi:MAG: PKD domain-containing protein [Deltaproteobacteria bacterium]|nr:PKD domain-containing protein [Deltaproteobacteria bacterium]